MEIKSPAFENQGDIPAKYTCDGERVNPPLEFSGVPLVAKSLILIMDDIDVPKENRPDGIWNHWLLWNIPPGTKKILEGAQLPPGVSGHTTGGETEYQPPCPPNGQHRYVFKLYALDTILDLNFDSTTRDSLLAAMDGHILIFSELTGKYERKK